MAVSLFGLVVSASDAAHTVAAGEVVYADDLALMLLARQAAQAAVAAAEVTSSIIDVFSGHGLAANFGKHKTAAIIAPTGAGSRCCARQKLFYQQKGRIPVLC